MNTRRIIAIALTLILALSLVACGGGFGDEAATATAPDSNDSSASPGATPSATPEETSDTGSPTASQNGGKTEISEEERGYRESCISADRLYFPELAKYDGEKYIAKEEHAGKAMALKGKVRFVFEWNGNTAYMFGQLTEDGNRFRNSEFLIVDMRENKGMEFKKDDVITVYGEYYGPEPQTKEMDIFTDAALRFDMRYAERND